MSNATRITVATFGVLAGIAGIEHGIGEILQGNVAPAAMTFPSWPDSAFFSILGGEPAMSIVPSFLVTGILAVLVSLVLLAWATAFAARRHGGPILILLSVVLLLVGGGFGPPLLGLVLGITATKIGSPLPWWHASLSAVTRQSLGKVWPWSFAAGLVAWLMLFPGVPFLAYLFDPGGTSEAALVLLLATIIGAFTLLPVTVLLGLARDAAEPIQSEARYARRMAG